MDEAEGATAAVSSIGAGGSGRAERIPVRSLVASELNKVKDRFHGILEQLSSATSGKKDAAGKNAVDNGFSDLLQASGRLRAATQVLYDHQQYQMKIVELEKQIEAKDKDILALSDVLRKVQEETEKVIFEKAKPLLGKAAGSYKVRGVDSSEVLDLARRLSYSTAAPPGWHFMEGVDMPFPYKPPIPQEDVIRRGHLFGKLETILKHMAKASSAPAASDEADGEASAKENVVSGSGEDSSKKRKTISPADAGESDEEEPPAKRAATGEADGDEDLFDI